MTWPSEASLCCVTPAIACKQLKEFKSLVQVQIAVSVSQLALLVSLSLHLRLLNRWRDNLAHPYQVKSGFDSSSPHQSVAKACSPYSAKRNELPKGTAVTKRYCINRSATHYVNKSSMENKDGNHNQNQPTMVTRVIVGLDAPKPHSRIVKGSLFKRLPAIQEFVVGKPAYNPILSKLGIKLRMPRKNR